MEQLATVDKAMDILFYLQAKRGAQGVTAIGHALGIPKSSTHRLLSTLSRRGLVERTAGGRYEPGIALVGLGLAVLDSDPVVVASRSILEEQAVAVGETFFLVAARAGRLVVLHKAEGSGFLRAAPRVGSHVPAHATAVGKLYLAFAPELLQAESAPPTPFTPHTLVDSAALDQSVASVRHVGWAENREEWIPGLSVLAVPVLQDGRISAALALAAASPRLSSLGIDASVQRHKSAAMRISGRLYGRVS